MSSNKLFRLMPLMRCARSGPSVSKQCMTGHRHYWPARRDSWDPLTEMQRSMDRLFREVDRFSPFSLRSSNPWNGLFRTVPVETTQDGQRMYKIELSLPDFKPEDINVTIKDRNITVKAKHESEADGCKQYREYSYQYTLPNEANIESVRSLLTNDGLLTIEAPLPQLQAPEAQEIPIQKEIDNKSK